MNAIEARDPRPQSTQNQAHSRAGHNLAVRTIEARQIARALRPFGILSREALKEVAGAARWHEGTFAGALARAVAMGLIDVLPFGFYRYRSDADPLSRSARTSQRG